MSLIHIAHLTLNVTVADEKGMKSVLEQLLINNKKLDQVMSQQEDLQAVADSLSAKVDTLQTTVDTKQAAIAQAIKDLEDKVGAQPDLQPIIDSLKATEAKIDTATADVDSTPIA